jgi:glycosyltransferase involved in cell wall biosynthesis
MPRVLVSTNERNYSLGLIEGYRNLGWEVTTGSKHFLKMSGEFDVIHHQWPEEFVGWKAPKPEAVAVVMNALDYWRSRAKAIFSVNNLYPHDAPGDRNNHDLYSSFYRGADLITHFSEASKELVKREYPASIGRPHIVHCPPNYAASLRRQSGRGSCREDFGIDSKSFVILVFGRLRSWKEIALIRHAFERARIPQKHLLMAGKLSVGDRNVGNRLREFGWRIWLKRHGATVDERYVPEEEIYRFIDSSDVMIAPRIGGLSSAIPLVAMTFGKTVIAPDCGAYPEYLSKSGNLLYSTGDPKSLALMLEKTAGRSRAEREAIEAENNSIARGWSWDKICEQCISALGYSAGRNFANDTDNTRRSAST